MESIHIVEDALPMAWERAVLACWQSGAAFRTEYDKPDDPPSRDVACLVHVRRPFDEPRIHRAFPGGLDDLEKYRAEMLYGVHDHWIDPAAGKWEYTYHERLSAYETAAGPVDQIAAAVAKLAAAGHTRRAQAITWQPDRDPTSADPPCLQRLWFRMADGRLDMTAHMRSNDAFKAAFMNMYAFTELQAEVAGRLGAAPGAYLHICDSFHIYGSYFAAFEGFLKTVAQRSEADRVYDTAFARPFFVDGCDALLAEDDLPAAPRAHVKRRRAALAHAT